MKHRVAHVEALLGVSDASERNFPAPSVVGGHVSSLASTQTEHVHQPLGSLINSPPPVAAEPVPELPRHKTPMDVRPAHRNNFNWPATTVQSGISAAPERMPTSNFPLLSRSRPDYVPKDGFAKLDCFTTRKVVHGVDEISEGSSISSSATVSHS